MPTNYKELGKEIAAIATKSKKNEKIIEYDQILL
jgi:hypothetical protein